MSVTWVICGAGRGVGKTTLAMKLCDVLPNSTYAKCGHGARQAAKPGNFFSSAAGLKQFVEAAQAAAGHVIVESNAWARTGRGDLIVFLDGIRGKTRFRKDADALRRAAHLRVTADASRTDWRRALKNSPCPRALGRAVCDVLAEQQRHLFGLRLRVRTKLWIEAGGLRVFGNGLARLLENIDATRTLQGAADAAGMSYRHAWDLICSAERHWGKALVHRHPGGARGGVSTLSEEGRRMLALFRTLDREVAACADKLFLEFRGEEASRV